MIEPKWRIRLYWPTTLLCAMFASVSFRPPTARGDHIELSTGGVLTGPVARVNDRGTLVKTPDGIVVAIADSAVRRRVTDDRLVRYANARRDAGTDPDANAELARWVRTDRNVPTASKTYRDFHLRRVVASRPNDSVAWATLGYKPSGNGFVPVDDLMRSRGMVRTSDGWQMPEVAMRNRRQQIDEVTAKTLSREIARLTKSILRGGGKSGEAFEQLAAIDDPLASVGIAEQFNRLGRTSAVANRRLRTLLLEKLIEFRGSIAVRTLVAAALSDPDPIVREMSLRRLPELPGGRSSAVATYLPMLRSNNNADVNRAAAALTAFADPELDLTYTDALVTQHKQIIAPGAGINTSFGNAGNPGGGGGGLSTGGKAKVVTRNRQNPAVLSLLRTIAPNVNFGYDSVAWRNYFTRLRTRSPGDLRADPVPPIAPQP